VRRDLLYIILTIAVLALSVIPVGAVVFLLGFVFGDSPCVMCWEQRVGMLIIALIGLFVLRYGPKPKYIGLSLLVGAYGIFHPSACRHHSQDAAPLFQVRSPAPGGVEPVLLRVHQGAFPGCRTASGMFPSRLASASGHDRLNPIVWR
jgi:disulfide bond formation protein DsbB